MPGLSILGLASGGGQQIGGQLAAGFHLLDLYEDTFDALAISAYLPTSIATRALKPGAD